jgi:hypothetical protein
MPDVEGVEDGADVDRDAVFTSRLGADGSAEGVGDGGVAHRNGDGVETSVGIWIERRECGGVEEEA